MDDFGEGSGDEAGAPDQGAVDVFLGHEGGDVFGLDGAAIEDPGVGGGGLSAAMLEFLADDAVGGGGDLGARRGPSADGPDGLVGDAETAGLGGGDIAQGSAD